MNENIPVICERLHDMIAREQASVDAVIVIALSPLIAKTLILIGNLFKGGE